MGNKDVLLRRKEKMKDYNKNYTGAHPYVKQMKSVANMKYMANLRGDTAKVEELEARYDELLRKKEDWRNKHSDGESAE